MSGVERAAWPRMPNALGEFLEHALEVLPEVPGIAGVALGGSFVIGGMDEQSDLDFVLGVDPSHWPEILDRRPAIASSLGPLLASFTGEHVGEPRLLICLYGPPLMHVDLKFVSLEDAGARVEDPTILWERDETLTDALAGSTARYPMPELAWIEERFWIWIHATAAKIERGEMFEVLNMLAYLRAQVLGPLALNLAGARPDGVRRIEGHTPDFAVALRSTIATPDPRSCIDAVRASVELYQELRGEGVGADSRAEAEVLRYIGDVQQNLT